MCKQMAQCARKTSAIYENDLLTVEVIGKNVTGTVKVFLDKTRQDD